MDLPDNGPWSNIFTRNSIFRNFTDTTKLIIRSRVRSFTGRERFHHKYISYIMSLWKHWLLGWWYPQQIIIVHQQLHFWFKLFKGKDIFDIRVTWVYMVYRIVSWTSCCCTFIIFGHLNYVEIHVIIGKLQQIATFHEDNCQFISPDEI